MSRSMFTRAEDGERDSQEHRPTQDDGCWQTSDPPIRPPLDRPFAAPDGRQVSRSEDRQASERHDRDPTPDSHARPSSHYRQRRGTPVLGRGIGSAALQHADVGQCSGMTPERPGLLGRGIGDSPRPRSRLAPRELRLRQETQDACLREIASRKGDKAAAGEGGEAQAWLGSPSSHEALNDARRKPCRVGQCSGMSLDEVVHQSRSSYIS